MHIVVSGGGLPKARCGEVVVDDLDVGGLVVCYPDFVDYCPIFVDLDYYGEAADRAVDNWIHDRCPDRSRIGSSHRLGDNGLLYIYIGHPQVKAYCLAGNALPQFDTNYPDDSDPHTKAARHPDSGVVDDHPAEDNCCRAQFGVREW